MKGTAPPSPTRVPTETARATLPGTPLPLPALVVPLVCGALLAGVGALFPNPDLRRALVGAGTVLLAWAAWLFMRTRDEAGLELTGAVFRHHWVQALAQSTVLLYWGWHVRFVYDYLPLLIAQIVFAYGIDALIGLTRRGRYALGFGPFPVIFSINLFLWFRPEWFHWQFVMIAVGYLAKELIRWEKNGRSAHIFNPSSFPLGVFSIVLIAFGLSSTTFGIAIATTQFYPPFMYAVIFLAALPGQLLFGVARMTLAAVVTMMAISAAYYAVAGTYLFYDTWIPVAIFLGMHLLFTDPSTSPRSESGRILFGMLYALLTVFFYVVLGGLDIPTFYDKLLPVPIMNLMVRRIDRWAEKGRLALLDTARIATRWPTPRRNLLFTSSWAAVFVVLSATNGLGDTPPGQSLAFWQETCAAGNERACRYADAMTLIYCNDGSGWACNTLGIRQAALGASPARAFEAACRRGFEPGCVNGQRLTTGDAPSFVTGDPPARELPIVLRGSKPPLTGWTPAELRERACAQGWDTVCGAR